MSFNSITLVSIVILTPVLVSAIIHHFIVLPRWRRELSDLNERRARRVQDALASSSNVDWPLPAPEAQHPFSSWVEFVANGEIRVAGQQFDLQKQFQVTARDERHLPRATIHCSGDGKAIITSHGQTYSAEFRNGNWQVELLNTSVE